MQIQREEVSDAVIFHLTGRLDASNSPVVEEHIHREIQADPSRLIFDFEGVEYLSSAGLRILLSATKKLGAGRVMVYGVMPRVMETVRMAGFDKVLSIVASRDDALG